MTEVERFDALSKLVSYDPETGEFRYFAGQNTGKNAGHVSGEGYLCLSTSRGGVEFGVKAHRYAFWCIHSRVPEWPMVVDHINEDKLDNRGLNLRELPHKQNCRRNRSARSDSKSRIRGVHWRKDSSKWRACIRGDGKLVSLGSFTCIKAAESAYLAARKKYGFDD